MPSFCLQKESNLCTFLQNGTLGWVYSSRQQETTASGCGGPELTLWIKGTWWRDTSLPGSSAVRRETSMRHLVAGMSPHMGVRQGTTGFARGAPYGALRSSGWFRQSSNQRKSHWSSWFCSSYLSDGYGLGQAIRWWIMNWRYIVDLLDIRFRCRTSRKSKEHEVLYHLPPVH